jgi:hypothetical protein
VHRRTMREALACLVPAPRLDSHRPVPAVPRVVKVPAWPGWSSGHMYATATESREQVTDFYRRVWAHSDATIEELPLDACGTVPWWPEERRHPTLHTLLVHAPVPAMKQCHT